MQSLDLNGAWQIRWSDGVRGRVEYANRDVTDESRYIDATVPGEVHLDLLRAGLISDPYRGAVIDGVRGLGVQRAERIVRQRGEVHDGVDSFEVAGLGVANVLGLSTMRR